MPTIAYYNERKVRLSGVTGIIGGNLGWSKDALNIWNYNRGYEDGRLGKDQSYRKAITEAGDAGTIAHYLIECDLKGIQPDTDAFDKALLGLAETAYLNFLEWKASVGFKTVAIEPHLISEKHQYGLTPDCLAEIRSKLSLFDWKSGNGVYEDMLIQLEAYRHGWDENHPDNPITGGYHLVRLDKTSGAFTYYYRDALPGAWEAFLALLQLHNVHKELKRLAK
jgi:hypothetical protein